MSKESHELSAEETAEFKDTLKALETTMRRHLLKETSSGTQLIVRPTLNVKPPVRSLSTLRRENTKISGPAMPSRKDKVIVQIRIVILKVGDIDTLRDKFAGDAFIQAKWREPAMDGKLKLQHEEIDWEVYWNPKLSIENAFGEPKENVWHSISFDAAGQATVCEKRRVTGSFFEFMELNQFPFDSQDLTITVTTDRSEEEIEFVEDTREKSTLNSQTFSDEQEWKLHKKVTTWTKVREEQFKAENSKHPSFCAATSVSRRPQFFIWNILVVMFLICSLSFATFSVSYNAPQSRLQLTFILLLTTVSFKFVVNQNLPMISYLTYLDKYILGSMAILATICIWHALVPFILAQTACNFQLIDLIDYIMLGSLSFIYVGFHLVFIGVVACQGSDNDEEEEDKQDFDGEQEDEFEDHENLGDNYDQNEKIDHRTARKNNAAEHATNQQTVMSGL